MAQVPRQMSLLRRHLSPLTQFLAIAILALFVGVAILAWPVIGKNVADPAGRAQPAPSEEARGTFRPTERAMGGVQDRAGSPRQLSSGAGDRRDYRGR